MSKLEDIKAAIEDLPEEERALLVSWLARTDLKAWDEQITADFSPGGRGLDLLEEVDAEIDRGEFTPLG